MINQELLKKYAEAKAALEKQEEVVKTMGVEVLSHLQENKVEKAQTDFGSFSLVTVPRWKYSDDMRARETNLAMSKKDERENGRATQTATTSLRFQAK